MDGKQSNRWSAVAGILLVAGLALVIVGTREGAPGKTQGFFEAPPAAASAVGAQVSGTLPVSESFEQSVARLEEILEASPDDLEALKAMTELMLASHQAERAIGLADRWLVASPDDPEALLQKVMAHGALEQWDEAIAVNRLLLELEPERPLTRLNMGSLYGNAGDTAEATRWWEELVADAPDSNEAGAARRALERMRGEG